MGLLQDARNTSARPPVYGVAIARFQPGATIKARVSPASPYGPMIG